MVTKRNASKFETIQCPKGQGIVSLARRLAAKLSEKSGVPGVSVPMYGAVKWALEQALKSLDNDG